MDKLVTSTDTQLYVSKVREIGKRKSVDKIKLVNASLAIANRNNSNILMGLENITSDGIISPTEKKQLSLLYEQMQAENSIIMVEVEKYQELPEWKEKAEYTAKLNSYISSWTSLSNLMKEILNDMENDSYISQTQLAEVSKAYYDNLKSLDEVLQLFRYGLNRIEYRYKTTQEQVVPSAEDITDESIPTMDSTNRFLWRKQTIYYSNGKTEVTVDLIAIYGDSGKDALVCSITCDKSHVTRNDRRSDSVDYLFTVNVQGYTEKYTVYIDNVDITSLLVDGKIVINKPYKKADEMTAEIYMAGDIMSSITLDVIDETGGAIYFSILSELPTDNSAYITGDSCVYNNVVYIFDGTDWKEATESSLSQVQISNALTSAMNDILGSLNSGDITATEYAYFKTIITNIITANYIGAKTIELQEGGCIQSLGFDPTSSSTGFKLNYDGTFQANDAIFRNVKITDGTLEAKALKTINEDTYGSWCATSGFPSDAGTWSGKLQIKRDSATVTIGTLSTAQPCYYDTKDWAQWMIDNIPINNDAFTKLDGTFYGYNAYAMRFSSDYWNTYSTNEYTIPTSVTEYEFTVSFEKYYKNVSLLIEPKTGSKISLYELYVYLDGGSTNYAVDYDSGVNKYECFFGELSPGTHTIKIRGSKLLGSQIIVVTTRTSIVPVYKNSIYENIVDGISSDRIMLRLYKGTDDSTVFEGGTASNPQYVCTVNGSPWGNYRYSMLQTYTNISWYNNLATNLSYNSSTLKCGNSMTGWTIPWYAKFTSLWEVGSPDSSGTVVWNTTPKRKSSCMYKVSNVFIDGVLYDKDFSVVYSGDTFNLRSEDGEIDISLSSSEYYSSLPSISYSEVAESQGSYVSSLYPLLAGESDIGSINQQFDAAYINNVYGSNIVKGTKIQAGTDSKVIIGQDSESGYINIYNVNLSPNSIYWHIDVYDNVLRFIRNGSTEICKITEAGVYGAVFN